MGGAGTVCLHLARGLADRGHQVEVVTAEAEGRGTNTGAAVIRQGKPLVRIGNAPLIPSVACLRGFDVLHLHYPFIFGTELALAGRLRSRGSLLVVSYHNRLIGERARKPIFWLYEETWGRLLVRHSDRLCVVSEAHADTIAHLRSIRAREPRKLAVLPNGVDIDNFAPGPDVSGVREAFGIPQEAVVAVFVATLDRAHFFKRLDLAIEAIALTAEEGLHMLVVGGGEWLERYRGQAADAGLAGRVHFMGPLDHDRLPSALRAADFLLLTSDLESFGIVLLEAMACGLPTVSTDPVGVRAVVRANRTGILAPLGDASGIAAAIKELLNLGPEGRRRLGLEGRAECEQSYAWGRLVEQLEQIYLEALEERQR